MSDRPCLLPSLRPDRSSDPFCRGRAAAVVGTIAFGNDDTRDACEVGLGDAGSRLKTATMSSIDLVGQDSHDRRSAATVDSGENRLHGTQKRLGFIDCVNWHVHSSPSTSVRLPIHYSSLSSSSCVFHLNRPGQLSWPGLANFQAASSVSASRSTESKAIRDAFSRLTAARWRSSRRFAGDTSSLSSFTRKTNPAHCSVASSMAAHIGSVAVGGDNHYLPGSRGYLGQAVQGAVECAGLVLPSTAQPAQALPDEVVGQRIPRYERLRPVR